MLLNKATLGLAKLASKEESRYMMRGIAIEKDCATVTDGRILVTVAHPQAGETPIEDSYPQTPGLVHRAIADGETVLVGRDAALAALKAIPRKGNLPILQNAAMAEGDKLITNDLASVGQFDHEMNGQFPDWRRVIPDADVAIAYETVVDARYLKALAEYFIATGNEVTSVRMTFYADDKPGKDGARNPKAMRFDARTADGQDVTAILMPMGGDDRQYPMRPDQARAAEAKKPEGAKAESESDAIKDATATEVESLG